MLTKKRLSHRGFTLGALCNALDKVQGNQKEALLNNGEGVLEAIKDNIESKLVYIKPEQEENLQFTVQHLTEKGISRSNCYLYMQGHSIYNLVCRIGKALMDESFEQQVLFPSFSVGNQYKELDKIKSDIHHII